ncbi:MAG TPA: macro domain-containing protein [Gemmatimonadaceae bacterium]|jgi:O-acetyl-ADP-ribose deacetylase (regulator of RNase III)|nr:macro domain-containing protein [Gemmatimonadaceae bacterium]
MISVRTDDLAFVSADAIARPVDAELRATTPLMRRLEVAGGDALARHLSVNEPLAVGSAVVTPAGALGAELLIHGVVSSDTEPVSRNSVRQAVIGTLQRAADWGIEHLALAPFGTGAGNLDVEEAAEIVIDAVRRHCEAAKYPTSITIVVETSFEHDVFERLVCGGVQ